MKYVALKDGSIMTFYDNADYMQYDNVRENFLKEGNSLDELCDRVVAVKKDGSYRTVLRKTFEFEDKDKLYYHCSLKSERGWIEDCQQWLKEFDLYFAIWTIKGLIYVAKMNENGELELI